MVGFDRDSAYELALMWSPLVMLILLVAIFRAARRWIVYDGLYLPGYFMAAVVLALVLPLVGVFTTAFCL